MDKIIAVSEKQTLEIGKKIGLACRGGESFFLTGNLGAGKTKLIQGLAKGLKVVETVNSPTFNILKIYHIQDNPFGIKYFCHVDAYRLHSANELVALGIDEFLQSPETVTAIEWGEKVKEIPAPSAQIIKIKFQGENSREIIIS